MPGHDTWVRGQGIYFRGFLSLRRAAGCRAFSFPRTHLQRQVCSVVPSASSYHGVRLGPLRQSGGRRCPPPHAWPLGLHPRQGAPQRPESRTSQNALF
jgi:hypothetical protein